MHFTKKLRTSVLTLGIVGASLFVACKPHNEPDISDPIPQDTIPETPHDTLPETPTDPRIKDGMVDLYFGFGYWTEVNDETVKKYQNMPIVDSIYLVTQEGGNSWHVLNDVGINTLKWDLIPFFNYSKVRGKGNLRFTRGEALYADSLWFVEHGWTVNKQLQNQR